MLLLLTLFGFLFLISRFVAFLEGIHLAFNAVMYNIDLAFDPGLGLTGCSADPVASANTG